MVKTILFTHNDMDGAGCRIIFSLAHCHMKPDEWTVINCSNESLDVDVINNANLLGPDTEICFGDICPSKEILNILIDKHGVEHIHVWDHHKTNSWICQEVPNAHVVPENELGQMECGTSLMYKYYCNLAYDNPNDPRGKYFKDFGNQELLPVVVDKIRLWDTYEWKKVNDIVARKLNIFFKFIGMEIFCDRYIKELIDGDKTDPILADGDLRFVIDQKIETENQVIDSITPDDMFTLDIRGHKTAFTFPVYGCDVSEFGNRFLEKFPEYDMFAYMGISNQKGFFSFRTTKEDFDTGKEIAVPIGGGGHPKASGAPIPEDIVFNIVNMAFDHLNGDYGK